MPIAHTYTVLHAHANRAWRVHIPSYARTQTAPGMHLNSLSGVRKLHLARIQTAVRTPSIAHALKTSCIKSRVVRHGFVRARAQGPRRVVCVVLRRLPPAPPHFTPHAHVYRAWCLLTPSSSALTPSLALTKSPLSCKFILPDAHAFFPSRVRKPYLTRTQAASRACGHRLPRTHPTSAPFKLNGLGTVLYVPILKDRCT